MKQCMLSYKQGPCLGQASVALWAGFVGVRALFSWGRLWGGGCSGRIEHDLAEACVVGFGDHLSMQDRHGHKVS